VAVVVRHKVVARHLLRWRRGHSRRGCRGCRSCGNCSAHRRSRERRNSKRAQHTASTKVPPCRLVRKSERHFVVQARAPSEIVLNRATSDGHEGECERELDRAANDGKDQERSCSRPGCCSMRQRRPLGATTALEMASSLPLATTFAAPRMAQLE